MFAAQKTGSNHERYIANTRDRLTIYCKCKILSSHKIKKQSWILKVIKIFTLSNYKRL